MAALPNTNTMDIPSRGLPAPGILNLDSGPNVDTMTLDVASRGLPSEWLRPVNTITTTYPSGVQRTMTGLGV